VSTSGFLIMFSIVLENGGKWGDHQGNYKSDKYME
jgi:hypothetical protein